MAEKDADRYGKDLCLLDATYKTSKYALPLFFVCVKTNVNYTVVASFVIETESTFAIGEALSILKSWNPEWLPKVCMVDFSEPEIQALECTFKGTTVLLCDFHREQAWLRWVTKQSNGVSMAKEEVLSRLRRIASASTHQAYNEALDSLKTSSIWQQSPKLQVWFLKKWIPEVKRWVWLYRKDRVDVRVNTNNGVERQNKSFKYEFLIKNRNTKLSGVLQILITQFLPQSFKKYIELNAKSTSNYRLYHPGVPNWLRDRPKPFVTYCMPRLNAATNIKDVAPLENKGKEKMYSVRSETEGRKKYVVSLGSDKCPPSCECEDWQRSHWPCKHFLAIFNTLENVGWHSLPKSYQDNPRFNLDPEVIILSDPMPSDSLEAHQAPLSDTPEFDLERSNNTSPTPPITIHSNQRDLKIIGLACRERLDQLRDLTYLCMESATLLELKNELANIVNRTRDVLKNKDGLIHNRPALQTSKQKRYAPLPLRKKSKLSKQPNDDKAANDVARVINEMEASSTSDLLHAKRSNGDCQQDDDMAPPAKKRSSSQESSGLSTGCNSGLQPPAPAAKQSLPTAQHYMHQPTTPQDRSSLAESTSKKVPTTTEPPSTAAPITSTTVQSAASLPTTTTTTKKAAPVSTTSNAEPTTESLDTVPTNTSNTGLDAAFTTRCSAGPASTNSSAGPTTTNSRARLTTIKAAPPSTSIIVLDDESPDPQYWINYKGTGNDETVIVLYQESSRNILDTGEELVDSEIHAGLQLLKRQFPLIGGLNDPAVHGDLVTPETHEFIQVINSGGHWVCLSSIGSSRGHVNVYDSGGSTRPNSRVRQHTARLLFSDQREIVIKVPEVQRQVGVRDCGLFALAFATSVCFGEDPASRLYDQDSLRQHYHQCLESLDMQPFPSTPQTRQILFSYHVKIFCECRMPDNGKKYVQCSQCEEWYHPRCIYIPKEAMRKQSIWYCSKCS